MKRKLGLESLESRRVCAGNVTASITNGTLTIAGDGAANYVDIQQANVGGAIKFVVTGKAFGGNFTTAGEPVVSGAATKINNGTAFRGVASKVSINMGAGNDAVVVGGKNLQVNVSEIQLAAGTGSDYARLNGVKISGGTNTSTLDMTGSGGFSNTAQAEAGNDKLVVNNLTLAGGSLAGATGGGADRVVVSNFHVTNLNSYVYFYAGNGVDNLSVHSSGFKKVSVYMGTSAEKDTVTIGGITSNEVTVDLGAGNNDLLDVSSVSIKSKTVLNGGAGVGDTLKVGSNVNAVGKNITGFEVKPPLL